MVSAEVFRSLALAFDGVEELPHFEKTSFRIRKKIFATLDLKNNRGCLKLSAIDQSVFSAFDRTVIYPIPNKWGKQGWTFIELKKVRKDLFTDMMDCSYKEVSKSKLKK